MPNHSRYYSCRPDQDQVKVAVYTTRLAADQVEQQRFQELVFIAAAIASVLSAFLLLG